MLLDSKYTIVPSLKFSLTFDDGTRKVITVKSKDVVSCSYKKNGEINTIKGLVSKIGCNFNSSLGAVGTTAYLQIDGSGEYSGRVEYIQPSQIFDIVIISTTDTIENVVCSVDNEEQRIALVRENEVGVFQYSLDGITWRAANGAQGMSAYECAVALGFKGTEEEWLESLNGKQGEPGEPGSLDIYAVFESIEEAEEHRAEVPKGKLVVIQLEQPSLFVRNGKNNSCRCRCCMNDDIVEDIEITGYEYVGVLTVGPKGEKGDPGEPGQNGKSAYQYAVEAGFSLSEEEFADILARCGTVTVNNFYMGPTSNTLRNTVIGPIDLRIFGYTNITTFRSKYIERIDISNSEELEDQTLIFPDPIILRAVPTNNEAAKPNVTIKGHKYVADCIMKKDGQVGVFRRIRYIPSYNGEVILGDWISSTGQLDMGARVQYTSYGKFEPFSETVQSQYKKFHTYDHSTKIDTTDGTYMSVSYPISVSTFIDEIIDEKIETYLEEKVPEIVKPIVEREIDEKIDEKIKDKQDKLIAGENITITGRTISSSANTKTEEEITTTIEVGGLPSGTVIPQGTQLSAILKMMLCPDVPPPPPEQSKVYFGVSDTIPESIAGLTAVDVDFDEILANGISYRFTSDDQCFVYAYKKSLGQLVSIKDPSGFENIDGWDFKEYTEDGIEYYIYYTKETLTVSSYKMNFIYRED